MPDTPPAAMPTHASTAKGMFGKDIAGFPVWVWLVIIGAGIGAVLLVKSGKLKFPGSSSSTGSTGLGLAVDPSTGLPYAIEGLQPAGGLAGGGSTSTGSGNNLPPPPQPAPSSTFNSYGNQVQWQQVTQTTNGQFPTMPYQLWQDTLTGTIASFTQTPPGVTPSQYWTAQGLGSQYQQFLQANPTYNPTALPNATPNPSVVQQATSPNNWPGQNGNMQARIGGS